jgi:hypothetical protein
MYWELGVASTSPGAVQRWGVVVAKVRAKFLRLKLPLFRDVSLVLFLLQATGTNK